MDDDNKIDIISTVTAMTLGLVIVVALLSVPKIRKEQRAMFEKLDVIEDSVEMVEIEMIERMEALEEKLVRQKEQDKWIVELLDEYDKIN